MDLLALPRLLDVTHREAHEVSQTMTPEHARRTLLQSSHEPNAGSFHLCHQNGLHKTDKQLEAVRPGGEMERLSKSK